MARINVLTAAVPTNAFDTARLEVKVVAVRTELHTLERLQFLAYHADVDHPMLVGNMLVTVEGMCGMFVDWLEVAELYRRQGFGRELFQGVRAYVRDKLACELVYDGVTPAGVAFCEKMYSEEQARDAAAADANDAGAGEAPVAVDGRPATAADPAVADTGRGGTSD